MNTLPSAKDIALSPFSFGKMASAVAIERPPPDCKTDRKQGKILYIRAKQKPSRVLKHRRANWMLCCLCVAGFWYAAFTDDANDDACSLLTKIIFERGHQP